MTGDAASLAATSSVLTTLAARLDDLAGDLSRAPGPNERRLPLPVRRSVRDLSAAAREGAQLAGEMAAVLQRAAYDQAQVAHRLTRSADEARAAGLVETPGGFAPPPGVAGIADPVAIAARQRAAADYAQTRGVATERRRREAEAFAADLGEIRSRLEDLAARLR